MSDRLDVVIVTEEGAAIYHQRWGATALYAMLLEGPEKAVDQASMFDRTEEIDDILAGCVIDVVRRRLLIAGPAEVISDAGPRRVQPEEVLPELAPHWPEWHLAFEPGYVVDPVVLYLRGLGLSLATMNEPYVVSDILGKPRFVSPAYTLDAPAAAPATPVGRTPSAADRARRLDELELSVRASNELENAGLTTFGDVIGKGRDALARKGISQRALEELAAYMEELGFSL